MRLPLCPFCGSIFDTRAAYDRHSRRRHNIQAEARPCPVCACACPGCASDSCAAHLCGCGCGY